MTRMALRPLLLLLACLYCAADPPLLLDDEAHAVESALFHLKQDPLAALDSFSSLSKAQKAFFASKGLQPVRTLLAELDGAPLEVTVSIELRLVGFDGDGSVRA